MRYRGILLVSALSLCAAGAVGLVACSPSKGIDNDAGDQDTGVPDTSTMDTGTKPDSGKDGGVMIPKCPTYPVQGSCDLVAQDCPNGMECKIAQAGDGGFTATCAAASTGSHPKGSACNGSSDCVPGTECIAGRCAPHCCMMGDDQPCGNSVPEGYQGTCSMGVTDQTSGADLGLVCDYEQDCKPFRIQPCPSNFECLVKDMAGSSKCVSIYNPPGLGVGQTCMYANQCADGMMCLGNPGKCTWVCYKGGGPFDAGVQMMDAGYGGCPNGKTCSGGISMLPSWLGVCSM